MSRLASLAAFLIFSLAGTANAATLGVSLGNTGADIFYGVNGPISPNIDLNAPAPATLTLTNNSQIIGPPPSSLPDNFVQPTGPLFGNSYLAILGTNNPGKALFTLGPDQNVFSFTWGTIDLFNTLVLTDARAVSYIITGGDILAQLGIPVAQAGEISSQTDITFTDPFARIVTAQFTSSQNAFEVANFGQSATPLPAALPLFGAALLGFAGYARRRNNSIKA